MNQYQQLKAAESYMQQFHATDSSGHDIAHVMHVVRTALFISEQEGIGNPFIIQMAALLHDTVDSKLTEEASAFKKLKVFLDQIDVSETNQTKITDIIENISYRNGTNEHKTLSPEGYIVKDADRLDAMGAIGIARTFLFAGHFNEPMWQGDVPSDISPDQSLDDYDPSAIKHFYDKLFKLKDLMHTETAKVIAQRRHQLMELFVTEFFNEWQFPQIDE